MASFCLSWCFTAWFNRTIYNFIMTGCRNFFLFFQNFITSSAMASFCLSCLFTGCRNFFVNNNIMSQRLDLFRMEFSTGTTGYSFQTGCCAGSFCQNLLFVRMFMICFIVVINRCMIDIFVCQTKLIPGLLRTGKPYR